MARREMLGPVEPRTWLMGTEAFEGVMPHHAGIRALWETKWRVPVRCLWVASGSADRGWKLGAEEWVLTGAVPEEHVSLPRRRVRGL